MKKIHFYSLRNSWLLARLLIGLFTINSLSSDMAIDKIVDTLAPVSQLKNGVANVGENGFVFNVIKNARPITLAQGRFFPGFVSAQQKEQVLDVDVSLDGVEQILNLTAKKGYLAQKVSDNIKKELLDMLTKAKEFVLKDPLFNEADFDLNFAVEFNSPQAGLFKQNSSQNKDQIYLNWHSFKNQDFLNIVLKNQLANRKLKQILPQMNSSVRQLYTLFNINLKEFAELIKRNKSAAYELLRTYNQLICQDKGLIPLYKKILNESTTSGFLLNNDFSLDRYDAYFKSLAANLPVDKNSLLPQIKEKLQKLSTLEKGQGISSEFNLQMLRILIEQYIIGVKDRISYSEAEILLPLKEYSGELPKGLEILKQWYGEQVEYRKLTKDTIYLKVKFKDNFQTKYAHIVLDVNDDIDSVLGSRGKIFSSTYKEWKQKREFVFLKQGTPKDRSVRWSYIAHMPISKFLKEISATPQELDSNTEMAKRLLSKLGITKSLSQKTWLQLWQQMKKTSQAKIPGEYINLNTKFNDSLDKMFPLLFLGNENFQYKTVSSLPIWLVTRDERLNSRVISWIHPQSKAKEVPSLYSEERISLSALTLKLSGNNNYLRATILQAA